MADDRKADINQKGAVNQSQFAQDAGKVDDGSLNPISKPDDGGLYTTKPGPGNVAPGQTSKM